MEMALRNNSSTDDHSQASEYVEMDLMGRYGRYNEVLGRGAFKTVYRAFDEVAWNQVQIKNMVQSPEDLEQIYSEVQVLRNLKHKNIMKIYSSWVDKKNDHINFITELFTSGTLKEYRKKHKHVCIQAIKKWVRQILTGLHYLHTHDPPIVHRDLKCDNIFINGNQGEVKVGDFGLAAILPQGHTIHDIVGTPEFVAPEMYESLDYDERVDIYAFGMCVLELATVEYPYSECANVLDIYKVVMAGKKPSALSRVQDPELKAFVQKCLRAADSRPNPKELLLDPFLQCTEDLEVLTTLKPIITTTPVVSTNSYKDFQRERSFSGSQDYDKFESCRNLKEKISLSSSDVSLRAKGERVDDETLLLMLRIANSQGHVTQIQFPFILEVDTAMGVASEVILEFDLLDEDQMTIADIIDSKVRELVQPNWEPVIGILLDSGDNRVGALDKVDNFEGSFHQGDSLQISHLDQPGIFNFRPKLGGIEMQDESRCYQIYGLV